MREIFRTVLFASLVLSGGAVTRADEARALRVQLATDGARPYEENLPGDVLATFSDAVFGQWIRLVEPGRYASDLIDYVFEAGDRRLIVRLKSGVRFHNGRAIDAEDFAFSLVRGLYLENHAFYRGFLGCLEGVSGRLSPGQLPAGVTIRSRSEVELRFTRGCPEIVHALGLPYVAPRPREELAADLVHFKDKPVGAGAYRVVRENVAAGEYEIRGAGQPGFVLLTKAGGQADVLLSRNAALAPPSFETSFARTPSTTTTLFASNRHPLMTPEVRALFYRAFDRALVVANAGETPAFNLSLFGGVQDVSAAERLDARAALRVIATKHPTLKIALFGSPSDTRKQRLITDLSKQFAEMGFDARFEFVNKKFLTEEDATEYAYQLANLVIDPLAPGVMLSSWRAGSANPFHRVSAPELESLFRAWEDAIGREARAHAAIRLDDFVSQQGFGVPLVKSRVSMLYDPRSVSSLGEQNQPLALDLTQVLPCASGLSR